MFIPMLAVPAHVVADHQHAFVAVLPRIVAKARAAFAAVRCPHDRADAVAEVVALAWERFRLIPTSLLVPADAFADDAVATVRDTLKRAAIERGNRSL